MTKWLSISLILFALLFSCNPKAQKGTKPVTLSCLDTKIDFLSKKSCEKGLSIKEYLFKGEHVFVIEEGNCGADMTTEVLDSNCKNLGYLGGITGNTEIKGDDFSKAEFIKTIWEK